SGMARRHDVTVLSQVGPEFDTVEAERAMRAYCEPRLVPARVSEGFQRRLRQLRSVLSPHTCEYHHFLVPSFRRELERLLSQKRFDVVQAEVHVFTNLGLRRSPPGEPFPLVVVDSHNVEYDLARQMASSDHGP